MPSKDPEYNKKYYQKNKEKIKKVEREKSKKYWAENKNLIIQRRKNHKVNKEKRKYMLKKWTLQNKEKLNKKSREWHNNNPYVRLKANIKYMTKLGIPFRKSFMEYKYAHGSWSKIVRIRDENKCVICGYDKELNAHHIFEKSKYPQLSLNPNNGVTLCVLHHQQVHGRKLNPYLEVRK